MTETQAEENAPKTQPTDEQCRLFREQGFTVARNLIDPSLIRDAVTAFDRLLDRALAGDFGDQFQWMYEEARLPHFQSDLLGPAKYDPSFGEILASALIPFAEGLLQKPVRCSFLLMLTAGAGLEYGVPLHRDNNTIGGEEEQKKMDMFRMNQTYFQAPLLADDSSLQVIPGSHLRLATEAEAAAAQRDVGSPDVPGLETIQLQPGDAIFRHTDMLHQGWNPSGTPRWTLVSALWAEEMPMLDGEEKYMAELESQEHIDSFPPRLATSVNRYVRMIEDSQETQSAG